MEWMSPMDASFLHIEGPNNPMHIGGASIFEAPRRRSSDLEEMVPSKLGLVPRYRQKVRFVRSARAGRCGWTTRTSTLTTTCATRPYRPRGARSMLRRTAARSSPSTSTATSRCGRSG